MKLISSHRCDQYKIKGRHMSCVTAMSVKPVYFTGKKSCEIGILTFV